MSFKDAESPEPNRLLATEMPLWLKVKMMIDATIKLTVPPEKRKEIIQTFKEILGPIRQSEGCLSCHCYVDIEAENNIVFKEEWNTRKDLDSHLKSNHFGVLVGAMKLLTQEPVIRFDTIESTAGAEELKNCKRDGTDCSAWPLCCE